MDYALLKSIPLKRRLGQNFLLDQKVLERIVENANLSRDDVVLEVGAGIGNLTTLLAKASGEVIAVEYDKRLLENLLKNTSNLRNVRVIEGDVLKIKLQEFNKIVSNLPFHISSKFIFWLTNLDFKSATLLLQKEFISKLLSKPGTREYGRLTVIGQNELRIKIIEDLPGDLFYPKPRVDISLVRITRRSKPESKFNPYFREMVTRLFTFRKKKLRSALKHIFNKNFNVEPLFAPNLLERRIFKLSGPDFQRICRLLYPHYPSRRI